MRIRVSKALVAAAVVAVVAGGAPLAPIASSAGAMTVSAFEVPASGRIPLDAHNVAVSVPLGDEPSAFTVTVRTMGSGATFTDLQPTPPPTWGLAHLGDALAFTTPVASGVATLLVRVAGADPREIFVEVMRVAPSCLCSGTAATVVSIEPSSPALALQIVPVVRDLATGKTIPTPTLVRDDRGAFESGFLVAFFDATIREYVSPEPARLVLTITTPDGVSLEVRSFGERSFASLVTPDRPYVLRGEADAASAALGAIASGVSIEDVPAAFVAVWGPGAQSTVAAWVAHHPGPLAVTASADGVSTGFAPADLITPGLGAAATGVAIVPADGDSDFDGFSTQAEIRAGSQALSWTSTPFTDDDDDGVRNDRDLNPLVDERALLVV